VQNRLRPDLLILQGPPNEGAGGHHLVLSLGPRRKRRTIDYDHEVIGSLKTFESSAYAFGSDRLGKSLTRNVVHKRVNARRSPQSISHPDMKEGVVQKSR
jgi:hypothetical protein